MLCTGISLLHSFFRAICDVSPSRHFFRCCQETVFVRVLPPSPPPSLFSLHFLSTTLMGAASAPGAVGSVTYPESETHSSWLPLLFASSLSISRRLQFSICDILLFNAEERTGWSPPRMLS